MKSENKNTKNFRNKNKKRRLIKKYFMIVFSIVGIFIVTSTLVAMSFEKPAEPKPTGNDNKDISNSSKDTEFEEDIDEEETVGVKTNVAVFGTDKEGLHTDVNFVVCFDSETKSISLVQVPRDTKVIMTDDIIDNLRERKKYVPYKDGIKGLCKLNEVHAYAGTDFANEFSVLQLEDLLGIKIDYFVKFDIKGFKYIVDAIGGVDMMVAEDLYYSDPEQNLYINLKAGYQHLDGDKAEQLVRFREGYIQKDLKRIEVQQDFMKAFLEKVLKTETILSNLPSLISSAFKYVTTDFGIGDAIKYSKYIKDIKMENVTMETIPGEGGAYFTHDPEGTQEIVDRVFYSKRTINSKDDTNLDDVETDITSFEKDSKNLSIEVANGGITKGLAGEKRDMLKDEGYNVTLISTYNGERQNSTRIIVKEKGMGEDLKEIFNDSEIEVNSSMITNGTDIKIILGLDEN